MDQPCVKVGIMSAPTIRFVFDTPYIFNGKEVTGAHEVAIDGGKVKWLGNTYDSLEFAPVNVDSDSFELIDVVIGVNFHWERKGKSEISRLAPTDCRRGEAHRH